MKYAIVTAGANGIGRCIVEAFIDKGYTVFVIDIDLKAGKRLQEQYQEAVVFMEGNVASKEDLEKFSACIHHHTNEIHAFVHNAGINLGGINTASYESFEEALRVGPVAAFYLTQSLKSLFKQTSVVLISSTRAFMSQPDTESYSASKGAIQGLTHALSISLAGIARVNAVAPGWIDTTSHQTSHISHEDVMQHPSRRIGRPEDIASVVLFLSQEDATFINAETIVVDGGMTKMMIYHNDHGWIYQD